MGTYASTAADGYPEPSGSTPTTTYGRWSSTSAWPTTLGLEDADALDRPRDGMVGGYITSLAVSRFTSR